LPSSGSSARAPSGRWMPRESNDLWAKHTASSTTHHNKTCVRAHFVQRTYAVSHELNSRIVDEVGSLCQHHNSLSIVPTLQLFKHHANATTLQTSCQHHNSSNIVPSPQLFKHHTNTATLRTSYQHHNSSNIMPTPQLFKQHANTTTLQTSCQHHNSRAELVASSKFLDKPPLSTCGALLDTETLTCTKHVWDCGSQLPALDPSLVCDTLALLSTLTCALLNSFEC
jgi:hypothetical protein